MTTEELLLVLRDIVQTVTGRDSFGGSIEYDALGGPPCPDCSSVVDGQSVLDPQPDCGICKGWGELPLPEGKQFWVRGLYRIGNSQGQGGMRIIAAPAATPDEPPDPEPDDASDTATVEQRRSCPYGCAGGHTQYEYDDQHRNPEGGYEPPWF